MKPALFLIGVLKNNLFNTSSIVPSINMIDFQEHSIPHIAQHFKNLRSNFYYKIPPEPISNVQISAILRIEKGQNTKSGNFIADTLLDDYVDYFPTSREELIFGTSEEIETLLARTFTNVIYPIFPHST